MKCKKFLIAFVVVLMVSCKTNIQDKLIHDVAIESDGRVVHPSMFEEGFVPSKIYCYITKDGKRIKDGKEYSMDDYGRTEVTVYKEGKIINAYTMRSHP